MEGQSGLSELSVISWVSAFQGCPLSGVPLYTPCALYSKVEECACTCTSSTHMCPFPSSYTYPLPYSYLLTPFPPLTYMYVYVCLAPPHTHTMYCVMYVWGSVCVKGREGVANVCDWEGQCVNGRVCVWESIVCEWGRVYNLTQYRRNWLECNQP